MVSRPIETGGVRLWITVGFPAISQRGREQRAARPCSVDVLVTQVIHMGMMCPEYSVPPLSRLVTPGMHCFFSTQRKLGARRCLMLAPSTYPAVMCDRRQAGS